MIGDIWCTHIVCRPGIWARHIIWAPAMAGVRTVGIYPLPGGSSPAGGRLPRRHCGAPDLSSAAPPCGCLEPEVEWGVKVDIINLCKSRKCNGVLALVLVLVL